MNSHLTIPFPERISTAAGWQQDATDETSFRIFRFHFYLHSHVADRNLYDGAPIAEISAPQGVIRTDQETVTVNTSKANIRETCETILSTSELTLGIAHELGSSISNKLVGGISNMNIAEMAMKVQKSVGISESTITAVEQSMTIEITKQSVLDGSITVGRTMVVPSYRKLATDVYLQMVDYLEISYERKGFQIRRRRIKNPPLPAPTGRWNDHSNEWRRRPNVSKAMALPLLRLKHWELVQDGRNPLREGVSNSDVIDPLDCVVEPLSNDSSHPLSFPLGDTRSLYHLSNSAFQLKWWKAKPRIALARRLQD